MASSTLVQLRRTIQYEAKLASQTALVAGLIRHILCRKSMNHHTLGFVSSPWRCSTLVLPPFMEVVNILRDDADVKYFSSSASPVCPALADLGKLMPALVVGA